MACGDDEATGHGPPPEADAGQGGDSGQGGEGGEGGENASDCTPLALGDGSLHYNIFGELAGIRYELQAEHGDTSLPDYVLIEFYDSTTEAEGGFLPPLESGEFDLSEPPDDRLGTCQHCVSFYIDVLEGLDPGGLPQFQPMRVFYARSGSIAIDEIHDPMNLGPENSVMAGRASDVELREIDLADPELHFSPSPACFSLAEVAFDTRPTPGADCEDLDDCGNPLLEVCDPTTLTCLDEVQCTIDEPCEGNAFCVQQNPLTFFGACYPACTPFASGSCEQGQTCVQYGLSEQLGYCLYDGDTALGEECELKDAVNDCEAGAVCLGTCVEQCGFFSSDPECSEGACDVLGHCLPADAGDPAALGEECHPSAELAGPCARNGARFDGICFTYGLEPPVCGKSCFADENDYTDGDADDGADDPDCAEDEFCALRFSSGLGICLPDPVCGDGAFGEVGEACDDGNLVSDDGCSADCQTVEYGPLCAAAIELGAGDSVEGDTEGAVDGFQAMCQLGVARGVVYSIQPPGPGQLELVLTSDTSQVVSVRSACDAAESETACGASSADGSAPLVLQVTEAPEAPLTVLVNANTVLDEGPFTLAAEFTPQVCGDGLVVGSEACDDGNEQAGDGCSDDCSAIEYDFWCDDAETLPLDTAVSGEIDGQPHLFSPSCGYGAAPQKLYRLTAPRAGTLTVTLDQMVGDTYIDLALFALDGCGPPDTVTELECTSVYDPERLTLSVSEDQAVFLVVDGLNDQVGEYELTAELD